MLTVDFINNMSMFSSNYNAFNSINCRRCTSCTGSYQFGNNWLINFLSFGRLGENKVVTAGTTTQVVLPSARNRYLESVTINPAS